MKPWGKHVYRIGNEENLDVQDPDDSKSIEFQKKHIEPWLAAVLNEVNVIDYSTPIRVPAWS